MSAIQFPIVVDPKQPIDVEKYLDLLRKAYFNTGNKKLESELVNSWRETLELLKQIDLDRPAILEYPMIGGERADLVFLGKDRGVVVELKHWSGNIRVIDEEWVKVGNDVRLNPCYQVKNYVNKLNYFHSSQIRFEGYVMFLGNSKLEKLDDCKVLSGPNELSNVVKGLGPFEPSALDRFLNGKYYVSESLVRLIKQNGKAFVKNATKVLLAKGFGLTEDQLALVREITAVLDELKAGKDVDKTYLVRGGSGSGKTLVAIVLLLEGIKRKINTVLAYKNNRLLNTLKRVLGEAKGSILFYSTGKGYGVAEENFDKRNDLAFVIFDEAQRMRPENIEKAMNRGKVRVFFYDEKQILLPEEVLTEDESEYEEKLKEIAKKAGKEVEFRELPSIFREDKAYVEWVERILSGEQEEFPAGATKIEFKVFDDVVDMLSELKKRKDEGYKVALVCAFTESPGHRKNPKSCCNVRIGYPICRKCEVSDLDIYKGVDLRSVIGEDKVYWLMDEKRDYPKYWLSGGGVERCASVYGAQGFEADYVGVVWGRDLVWRNGKWEVNPGPITDNIGRRNSLMNIARSNKDMALKLLRNRYYVMLTRGIRGVYVFAEDEETRNFLKGLV